MYFFYPGPPPTLPEPDSVTKPPLHQAILDEATKLVVRHQTYASRLAETHARIRRRGLVPPATVVRSPEYWQADEGFNPYHVRPRAEKIAYSIRRTLRQRRYQPRAAVGYSVAKMDGGIRHVSVFQVADNAVSRILYKNLLAKNARQFSAYCYAYREDLTAHDAVSHLAADFQSHPRLFVAEFDFRKYFDSISHSHLRRLLESRRFYITKNERDILEAFLTAPTAALATYPHGGTPRSCGIPQGTSISLFLANLAGFPLDRRLERLGVGFARYADDTVIWSSHYNKICQAVDALNDASAEMGVELNFSKSEGISILSPHQNTSEFRSKASVAFVGYAVGPTAIGIRDRTLTRAKQRLSQIIYTNLLEAPEVGVIVPGRISGPVDIDYVTMIYQLRRFLYGGLTESKLARYLSRSIPVMHFRGFMSYYPLVDDDAQLKHLDGWLFHTVWTSIKRRERLLAGLGATKLPSPHGISAANLIHLQGATGAGKPIDLTLPSFYRIARMFRKATRQFGANAIAHPNSGLYYLA